MKVKQSDDGQYYDVRILKHTDEDGVNKIIDKQKKSGNTEDVREWKNIKGK